MASVYTGITCELEVDSRRALSNGLDGYFQTQRLKVDRRSWLDLICGWLVWYECPIYNLSILLYRDRCMCTLLNAKLDSVNYEATAGSILDFR